MGTCEMTSLPFHGAPLAAVGGESRGVREEGGAETPVRRRSSQLETELGRGDGQRPRGDRPAGARAGAELTGSAHGHRVEGEDVELGLTPGPWARTGRCTARPLTKVDLG